MKKALLAVAIVGMILGRARADLYWDTDGATAGGSAATTAPGNWGTDSFWSTSSAGTANTGAWVPGETAVFSAGTDVSGAYTVTLATPITLAGIRREEGTPTISGLAANTLSFPSGLAVDTGSGTLIVSAFYGTTNGVITKSGSGIFSSGTSQTSFAGKWVGNAGSLSFAGDTRIGVVPGAVVPDQITLNNGAKVRSSTATVAFNANRGITLGTGGGGFDQAGTVTLTWNGPITGTSGGALLQAGAGVTILTNTSNNWDGATTITSGTLRLGASGVIPDASAVTVTGTFDMNGMNETIGSLAGAGPVTMSANLTTGGNNSSTSYSGLASGVGGLTKQGAGTMTLAGAAGNSYGGGTIIDEGRLLANNSSGSATGAGAVLVNDGGTLGGTGSVAGQVTVANGGTLSPGASPGTLTINNNLVLNSMSQLAYELSATNQTVGGGVNDLTAVVGNLALDGVLNVSETGSGTFLADAGDGDQWTLITYTGTLTDNGLDFGSMPPLAAGLMYSIEAMAGQVNLLVTAVPEAGAFVAVGLVGLLSAGAVWIRKRRAGQVAA